MRNSGRQLVRDPHSDRRGPSRRGNAKSIVKHGGGIESILLRSGYDGPQLRGQRPDIDWRRSPDGSAGAGTYPSR